MSHVTNESTHVNPRLLALLVQSLDLKAVVEIHHTATMTIVTVQPPYIYGAIDFTVTTSLYKTEDVNGLCDAVTAFRNRQLAVEFVATGWDKVEGGLELPLVVEVK